MKLPLNENSTLTINIIDATFIKDADTFGKQDPYIKFQFAGIQF
jgi:Ca2+-dependent lipid-binding protein